METENRNIEPAATAIIPERPHKKPIEEILARYACKYNEMTEFRRSCTFRKLARFRSDSKLKGDYLAADLIELVQLFVANCKTTKYEQIQKAVRRTEMNIRTLLKDEAVLADLWPTTAASQLRRNE